MIVSGILRIIWKLIRKSMYYSILRKKSSWPDNVSPNVLRLAVDQVFPEVESGYRNLDVISHLSENISSMIENRPWRMAELSKP